MAYYDVGGLFADTISYNNFSLTPSQPTDYFEFTIYNDNREVNLYLHDISANDNADLLLYRDQNGNGILDNNDALMGFSGEDGNADDLINFEAIPGTYFARVNRNKSGSNGTVTYDLDLSAHYNVGALGSTPKSYTESLSTGQLKEVYEFELSGTRYVHLTLDNYIHGEADLRLYQDNGNGFLDDGDALVVASLDGDRFESIHYKASAATYFAEVEYDEFDLISVIDYKLKMSANLPTHKFSNLVVGEVDVGDITHNTPDQVGLLNDTNVVDTYEFSLDYYEGVNIRLTDLTSDASIVLIQDSNYNGIVDTGEIIDSSYTFGTGDEQINNVEVSGNYLVQIFQATFGGDTTYTLEFDHFSTPHA
ncbi:MAG: hypothetical protein F6K42_17655 [Leptolyngbya sp. SIO1D8]|nr:hypothetical protein [Leptolyngbya sp. SIO1D8]